MPPTPTPSDLDLLDAIRARLAVHAAGQPTPDRPLAAIERDLAKLARSMRRDRDLAAAAAGDALARVQGALDRLDFLAAARGHAADPEFAARLDELKAALGLALGTRDRAAA